MSYLSHTPNLPGLIEKHGLKCFVETGCGDGAGLRHAAELGLDPRYSCDTHRESVALCEGLGGVFHLPSTLFLTAVSAKLNAPALFWLDAHFPEKFGAEGDHWPLLQELQILSGKSGADKDVIICDDMHCIQDPLNPTREDGPGHDWEPVAGTIAELVELFPDHTATLHQVNTGILVFEPK